MGETEGGGAEEEQRSSRGNFSKSRKRQKCGVEAREGLRVKQ